jgi:fructose/tagatose bisphosphate aldolase
MNKFKLGAGPMSRDIIDILSSYSRDYQYPLMIIASRNQVDYVNGYVCNTHKLVEQVKQYKTDKLLLCRDHCGPYFSDADRHLTLEDAMDQCFKTISEDIANGFDLIHIDVSRIEQDQLRYATRLIEYTLNLNSNIMLEFGSENNTGVDLKSSIGRIDIQLEFLQKYKSNIKFFVTQTGSLTKENQSGCFDVISNRNIVKQVHEAGFLFKEHNADYFTSSDITKRIEAGVDSLNIAPQLGKVQTEILYKFAPDQLWEEFSTYVYKHNYWQRWVQPGVTDKQLATIVSGHYCFNSAEYNNILNNIDVDKFKQELKVAVVNLINFYRTFDYEI